MYYNEFMGLKLSALGFGAMRFPANEDGSINTELTQKMIDMAYQDGVNYYDTAFVYLGGKSEGILADCLKKYPRGSYYLADKLPGHQFYKKLDTKLILEEQLRRLKTDYIDFYLLHNVNDSCMDTYMDEKLGIIPCLLEEKKKGKIRFLGFSAHTTLPKLKVFLEYLKKNNYPMDFCQIQLNYLDWTLQKGKEKVELLKEYGLPIWVMEPVRGGKLAKLPPEAHRKLEELDPGKSDASRAFRWLMRIPEIKVILSGMSSPEQVTDNLDTFRERQPLSEKEAAVLEEIAEGLKDGVPCTGCRYCTEGCPAGIDIPYLMELYNEYKVENSLTPAILLEAVPEEKRPKACLGCGACAAACPQHIEIPEVLKNLDQLIEKGVDWKEICAVRNKLFDQMAVENTGKSSVSEQ